MPLFVRSNLRQLIVAMALLSAIATATNVFITSAQVQKQALIDNTLQSNEAYAIKLADNAQIFMESALFDLGYSAQLISDAWQAGQYQQEINRLSQHNNFYNSVLVVDKNGTVLAASGRAERFISSTVNSIGTTQAFQEQQPLVSSPYTTTNNNLLILISHPIFDDKGNYLGFIGGTIHLEEKNILNRLLGDHYHLDGSYIYVIDKNKTLLYHPDSKRLGTVVTDNAMLDLVISGNAGYSTVTNSQGIEMLAGYAYIPVTDWGVVSQRPKDSALRAHEGLMLKIVLQSLPVNLAMFALIWVCAWLISSPLRQLATNVKNMREQTSIDQVAHIRAWYFEVYQLKQAYLSGLQNIHEQVGQLRHDVRTDPLTGLNNRRALDHILEKCDSSLMAFSAITLDIDHFKRVNDTYGHDVGDLVLKELAEIMLSSSRKRDFSIRLGGEEFLILLPDCPLDEACEIAERLRLMVKAHHFTKVGQLTISLGVAHWPSHSTNPHTVLKMADEMLYAAKQGGRNQVQVASSI